VFRYRGADPDAAVQRSATARFVGLAIPEQVPLGRSAEQFADKYRESLTAREGDISQLQGLEYLKAQYYGAPKAPGSAGGSESGSEQARQAGAERAGAAPAAGSEASELR
jgi:hypothetical protein